MACFAGLLLAFAPVARGQDDACLDCHRDPELSMEQGGATVSLFVDAAKLAASKHGGFSCKDCHEGFDGSSFPHRDLDLPLG